MFNDEDVALSDASGEKFKSMISNNKLSCATMKNCYINDNDTEYCNLENCTFENVSFINVQFTGISFNNCTFTNCKFIDCHFFDSYIHENRFIACHFDEVSFYNNLDIVGNTFERVTGNIAYFIANGCHSNIFKDMDFTGFLPFYIIDSSYVRWNHNYFINTSINTKTLAEACENVTKIYSGVHQRINVRSYLSRSSGINPATGNGIPYMFNCPYDIELPIVREFMDGVHDSTCIDLSNMSEIAKLNCIAGIFINYQKGQELVAFNHGYLEKSFFLHYTVPNPRPATLVDNRGYILNPGVIKDINFNDTEYNHVRDYEFHDGQKLFGGIYNVDDDILNPNNYSCRSLSIRK